jgi:GLPGLI family protein
MSNAQGDYTIVYTHTYGIDSLNKPNYFGYRKLFGALLVQGDSLMVYRLSKNKKDLLLPFDMNSNKAHHGSLKRKQANFCYEINFNNRKTAQFIIHPDTNYEWIIEQDTTTVCGFPCIKAKSSSGLTAWFTPSFTAKFGPFDYTGLPGTILKLYDNDHYMLIEANQVIANCPTIIFPKDTMNIVTREEFLKERNNNQSKK